MSTPFRLCRGLAIALSALVGATVLATTPRPAFPPPPAPASDPVSVFAAANDRFHAGLRANDAATGSGLPDFLASAALYHSLIAEHGIQNHTLHASRASALLLAGDTGRAIAAFRRAQRLDPTDRAVRDGLAAARRKAGTPTPSDADARIRQVLLSWRGHIPRPWLLGTAVGAFGLVWLAASARVLGFRRATPIALASLGVTVIALAPLAAESILDTGRDAGVVIADQVVGLNGPSSGAYPPTFTAPLGAGVEFDLLEQRDNWVHVRLNDGRDTWLPADSIERI